MIKVGITGGIGSGKSTVCRIFEVLGVPVYFADDRAKWLMQNDKMLISQIKNAFGDDIYDAKGVLRRKVLADRVFNNERELKKLNGMVHPAVFMDTQHWMERHRDAPYVLKEAALLVETGSYKQLDKLIVVTAPKALRIQRITERDQVTEKQVEDRMANQLPEEEKIKVADYLINNDGRHELIPQVKRIHAELIELAKANSKD